MFNNTNCLGKHALIQCCNYFDSNIALQYSKSLGNCRSKIISDIETIIWEELFNIAQGMQTVQEAASKIMQCIPESYNHFDAEIYGWFMLSTLHFSHWNLSFNQMNVEPIVKKENYLNLSSYSIKTGTIPE